MPRGSYAIHWIITIANPTFDLQTLLDELAEDGEIDYGIGQLEIGDENGLEHYQIHVQVYLNNFT